MKPVLNFFWFRRDLRLSDNAGLYHALKSGHPVLPVFIFDTEILGKLSSTKDARVEFIHERVGQLKTELRKLGSDLLILHGKPEVIWENLCNTYNIAEVFTNRDYEPYARRRDQNILKLLNKSGIQFRDYKDHCIFEYNEVLKDDGLPYTVFTPYSRKWKEKLNQFYLRAYPTEKYQNNFHQWQSDPMPLLHAIGFETTGITFPPESINFKLIREYAEKRNFPAVKGSSRLSLHFRFGTISIREKAAKALTLSETWLNELIWRDFYIQIMANFPHAMQSAFKPDYNNILWRNDTGDFEAWCEGRTGYPIVDAGMRELNHTGFMHNRVRMITASFLCKHLLIDWRWGEAYFAEKLLDFELASNNGGWQWAAGSGVDAAPYFRIFNPALQTEKFDPDHAYIKRWVPEFGTAAYPKPIVDHTFARKRCLDVYKVGIRG